MTSIFEYDDYRKYIRHRQAQLPKKGWGFISQMGQHLGVTQVQVSQVLGGTKDFTLEQALSLADFLELDDASKEYFVWLVIRSRSGSEKLKSFSNQRIEKIRRASKQVTTNFRSDKVLTEEQRNIFYSHQIYSAVRLYLSLGKGKTIEDVCEYFRLPRSRITKVLEFLTGAGLAEQKGHRFLRGPSLTVVGRESPHLLKHLTNWRLQAIAAAPQLTPEEMMISFTVALSRKDFSAIQSHLMEILKQSQIRSESSESEMIACLNMDWFEVK